MENCSLCLLRSYRKFITIYLKFASIGRAFLMKLLNELIFAIIVVLIYLPASLLNFYSYFFISWSLVWVGIDFMA